MYVDSNRGFGVVAFHFNPEVYEELKDLTGVQLFSRLLAVSEPVDGQVLPQGIVRGAANVLNVTAYINRCVVESLVADQQNARDDRVASKDVS